MHREYKKVESVKTIQHKTAIVYNLHVEDDSSFIANNIIVGNTDPHFPPVISIYAWLWRKKTDLKLTYRKNKTAMLNGKSYNADILGIAWSIAKNMSIKGTEAKPFMRPAFNEGKSKAGQFIKKRMSK